jgi:hypothetical protein
MKTINKPYTYLIGWSSLNKFYYGVRYAKNCHPSDLWKKYFTSSKIVKKYRTLYGEPDIIEVRKTFSDINSAIIWEQKVLNRLKVLISEKWLNANVAGAISPSNKPKTKETKQKISKGVSSYIEKLSNYEKSARGQKRVSKLWEKYRNDDNFKKHINNTRSKQINPMKGKFQKRVSCIMCKTEYPINIFSKHIKADCLGNKEQSANPHSD